MPKKNNPGCGCCEHCITVFTDTFNRANSTDIGSDWSEVAGDWSIASNVLSINSTNAFVECVADADTQANRHIKCSYTSGIGSIARLYVNYQDANNSYFAEYQSVAGGERLKIYKRVAGVNTFLNGRDLGNSGGSGDISLCISSDGVLFATYGSEKTSWCVDPPTSERVGIGTGSSVAGGAITFDDFVMSTASDDCEPCKLCRVCENAAEGSTACQYKLTISGMSGTGCCDPSMDGEYILDMAALGSESCRWIYKEPCGVNTHFRLLENTVSLRNGTWLETAPAPSAVWTAASFSAHCAGATYTKSFGAACYPSTVTVGPV